MYLLGRNERMIQIDLRNRGRAEEVSKNSKKDEHNDHQRANNRDFIASEAPPHELAVTLVVFVLLDNLVFQNDLWLFSNHALFTPGLTVTDTWIKDRQVDVRQ